MADRIYKTAYEEALGRESAGESLGLPSYLVAGDTLNMANRNQTFGESISSFVEDIPKFITTTLISGANQLYNIAPDVGNLLGGDFERVDTQDVINEFDSDYGKFYEENQDTVDLVGFIASSLVPGSAGVKLLNVGQTALKGAIGAGKFGTSTGKALGLLTNPREKYLKEAISQVVNSNSAPSIISGKALQATAAGFGQAALEGAAFEIGVAATMFNSPILENMDLGDLTTNIAFSALTFGAIGGAVDAAKTSFALKRAVKEGDEAARPWTRIPETAGISQAYERITLNFEELHMMPPVPTPLAPDRAAFLNSQATKKIAKIEGRIQSDILELTGGDQAMATTLFATFRNAGKADQQGAFIGLDQVSRLADAPALEKTLGILERKIAKGTASISELDKYASTARTYTQAWGENVGKLVTETPVPTALIDSLKKGQSIRATNAGIDVVNDAGVKVGKGYSFSMKAHTDKMAAPAGNKNAPWDISVASPFEANARHIWAQKVVLPKISEKTPFYVDHLDIPMLERVFKEFPEGNPNVIIRGKEKSWRMTEGQTLQEAKLRAMYALEDSSQKGLTSSSADVAENRLRSMLGLRFTVEDLRTLEGANGIQRTWIRGEMKGFTKISIDEKYLSTTPLHKVMQTLLHEEGHSKYYAMLDNGEVPKEIRTKIINEMRKVSKKARPANWDVLPKSSKGLKGKELEFYNYMNDTHELMADTFAMFSQMPDDFAKLAPTFEKHYGHLVRPLKPELVKSYMQRSKALTQDEMAAMVNVKSSWAGGIAKDVDSDLFAMQSHAKEYTENLIKQGVRKESDGLVDIWNVPQTVKMTYDTTGFKGINGHITENMQIIKSRQRLYQKELDNAAAEVLGADYTKYVDVTSDMIFGQASRNGSGPTFLGAANGNYGSLQSAMQFIGLTTSKVIDKFKTRASDTLEPLMFKLKSNPQAAIDWSTLNATIRAAGEPYALNEAGTALEPLAMLKWKKAAKEASAQGKRPPDMPALRVANAPLEVPVSKDIMDLTKAHIEINGKRTQSLANIRSAQGVEYTRDPATFYPIPVDSRDFPHFAIVTDGSVTGMGHHSTIYAKTAEELDSQIRAVEQANPHFKIRTKNEAEQYFKDIGQYDYEKTISHNYIDTALQRMGVSAPHLPATDPTKIVNETMNWHMQRETGIVREAVSAKYEVQFKELKSLGDAYTDTATSKFSSFNITKYAEDTINNPYVDFIKTALNVSKKDTVPFWSNLNETAEKAVSTLLGKVTGAVESASTEAELLAVGKMMEKAGYKGAAYSSDMLLFANATADKRVLTNTVQMANSVMAAVVLRMDAINAAVNAVSANVLLGAETAAVVRAIGRGDSEAVGALAKLTQIMVPGTDKAIFAPKKLIQNSMLKFGKKNPDYAFYKEHGFISSISDQYSSTLETLAYAGEDIGVYAKKVMDVQKGLKNLADTGEKWTGNRLAEEFNRFVAADVMKQMTDVAVKRNLMTAKEQLAYINTFVNRTQGNYLAAQRPLMFQGPVGQAIGLFQTYQFNLMQQMLRHVGEGHAKDAMTLLGLQGTIHGMNGLPAFNAINTHLIGTASGNTEHKDMYTATYGALGQNAGDWLMYGLASNAMGLIDPDLKMNLYTRGDINPRQLTIVPTNPADIAIVQGTAKFFGNIYGTGKMLAQGGDPLTTILQGIEHNGLSRPLAGLAQTLKGLANPLDASYSTTNSGNIIASNDMFALANIGRILGAKPLDEAVALDATFRFKAYALVDSERRAKLGQSIKTTMIAGNNPTAEQIENFAESYASAGGRQKEFGQWMAQLNKTANLSQANAISQSASSPFATHMQELMGGTELRDFK